MRTSHRYSELEVYTYDCAPHNGNLHAFTSARKHKKKMRTSHRYSELEVYTYNCAPHNGNLHAFTSARKKQRRKRLHISDSTEKINQSDWRLQWITKN